MLPLPRLVLVSVLLAACACVYAVDLAPRAGVLVRLNKLPPPHARGCPSLAQTGHKRGPCYVVREANEGRPFHHSSTNETSLGHAEDGGGRCARTRRSVSAAWPQRACIDPAD